MTPETFQHLPYRPNVAALIFPAYGHVLIARRTDMPALAGPLTEGVWQCPPRGLDGPQTPHEPVLRAAR